MCSGQHIAKQQDGAGNYLQPLFIESTQPTDGSGVKRLGLMNGAAKRARMTFSAASRLVVVE